MRERYIDLIKGWSIIMIVFLHFENGILPGNINVFIGSFMISTFYVTTGWLDAQRQKPMSFRELMTKRWHQLGLPYLWWSLIIIVFDCILWAFGYYNTYFIAREVYKAIILRGIGTLWFLPALWGGEIIWWWMKRHKWAIVPGLILTLLYFICYGSYFHGKTDSIWRIIDGPFRTMSNALTGWIGICGGYYGCRLLMKLNMRKWDKLLALVIGVLVCIVAYYVAVHCPISLLWTFLAPQIGPLGFIIIFYAIQNLKITNYLDYWGRNSLALMVTHYSLVQVLLTIIYTKVSGEPRLTGWPSIWMFVIAMVIEYPIALLITNRYPFLLGKKKATNTQENI